MNKRFSILLAVIPALVVAAIVQAQPGLGLSKDTTLTGNGSSGSPLGVNTTNIQRRVTGTCGAGSAIGAVGADGTVTCTGGVTDGDKGDITVSSSGAVFTIDPSTVTSAKLNITTTSCSAGNAVTAISAGSVGTCSAVGTVTGTGTNNTVAKWTGASSQGNSSISDNGTTVSTSLPFASSTTDAGRDAFSATLGATGAVVANLTAVRATNAGTYNTSGGTLDSKAIIASNSATRSAGTNDLTNYGIFATASGGQINYSGYFDAGSFFVNGPATLNGGATVNSGLQTNTLAVTSTSMFSGAAAFNAAATVGDFRATVISPASISGAVNDWNPTGLSTAAVIRVTSGATATITGIQGGAAGRVLVLRNIGANAVNYNHEDAGSIAANRLSLCASDNWTDIGSRNDSMTLVYSGATSRWEQICRTTLPRAYVVGSATLAGPSFLTGSEAQLGDELSDVTKLVGTVKDASTAPTLSTCGTTPSVTGGKTAFVVTTGTGATACTITFASTFTLAPSCVVSARSGTDPVYTVSATALTLTTAAASAVYDAHCIGDE